MLNYSDLGGLIEVVDHGHEIGVFCVVLHLIFKFTYNLLLGFI
jgi:hypothetical protein